MVTKYENPLKVEEGKDLSVSARVGDFVSGSDWSNVKVISRKSS